MLKQCSIKYLEWTRDSDRIQEGSEKELTSVILIHRLWIKSRITAYPNSFDFIKTTLIEFHSLFLSSERIEVQPWQKNQKLTTLIHLTLFNKRWKRILKNAITDMEMDQGWIKEDSALTYDVWNKITLQFSFPKGRKENENFSHCWASTGANS